VTIPITPVARAASGSTSGEKADMARRGRHGAAAVGAAAAGYYCEGR